MGCLILQYLESYIMWVLIVSFVDKVVHHGTTICEHVVATSTTTAIIVVLIVIVYLVHIPVLTFHDEFVDG